MSVIATNLSATLSVLNVCLKISSTLLYAVVVSIVPPDFETTINLVLARFKGSINLLKLIGSTDEKK